MDPRPAWEAAVSSSPPGSITDIRVKVLLLVKRVYLLGIARRIKVVQVSGSINPVEGFLTSRFLDKLRIRVIGYCRIGSAERMHGTLRILPVSSFQVAIDLFWCPFRRIISNSSRNLYIPNPRSLVRAV